MTTPAILPAPVLRVHKQRMCVARGGVSIPGQAWWLMVLISSRLDGRPVACCIFGLN